MEVLLGFIIHNKGSPYYRSNFKMKLKEIITDKKLKLPLIGCSKQVDIWSEKLSDNVVLDKFATKTLLPSIFGNSPYLSKIITDEIEFFQDFYKNGLDEGYLKLINQLEKDTEQASSQQEIMTILRREKRKLSLLVAMAEITEIWDFNKVTESLSNFAEICVKSTCDFLLKNAAKKGDLEINDLENPQNESGLVVLAMGKFGSNELNYSSDIDLIIFYDIERAKYTGRQSLKHFYINFTHELAKIINERTKDGYVFRVDLRLRPDPGSNPAAVSLQSAEIYYENLGQNWERAAMIKVRPVAGDPVSCERFMKFIGTYVWRRALDFESVQDIHSIKRQIDSRQAVHSESLYGYNVKLGRGGIREIEFFAQTQQLIWGGRRPVLREIKTCDALNSLVSSGELDEKTCEEMCDAYLFHRKIEHRLQMINDNQTHCLPETKEAMNELAAFMGYENADDFVMELIGTITTVKDHYAMLFNEEESLAATSSFEGGSLVFTGAENDPETLKTLEKMGFSNCEKISEAIRGWHHGRYRATRTKRARELLTKLKPALLTALCKTSYPDDAFKNIDEFLKKLPAGIQIFSLFYSNPKLLDIIAEIMGGYPHLATLLSRKPALLDYVLAPEFYESLPDTDRLKATLERSLGFAEDMQDILEITRSWTHERIFRIGIQLIKRSIEQEEANKNLSEIAEASASALFDYVTRDFEEKYGKISGSNFAILALGKLGGKELTFESDLDLVFIYDAPDNSPFSDGHKQLSPSEYFTRLSRRFVSSVSSLTKEGRLYEIDLRLRPSGNDGPTAASLKAFEQYYEKDAWPWEYLALTRGRVIASSSNDFSRYIEKSIGLILSKKHDRELLIENIALMRQKAMDKYGATYELNVKYHDGGLLDLEYISQFLQLTHSKISNLILDQNTKQAFKKLHENKIINDNDFNILTEAIVLYTKLIGNVRLIGRNRYMKNNISERAKRTLLTHTSEKKFDELQKNLAQLQKKVHKIFKNTILD